MTGLKHGRSRYCKGCRCDVCRAANTAYNAAYLAARPDKAQAQRDRSKEAMRRLRANRKADADAGR